jgi:hypothetical protein
MSPDPGTVDSNHYSSGIFGLSLRFPKHVTCPFQARKGRLARKHVTRQILASQNRELQLILATQKPCFHGLEAALLSEKA